MAKRTPEQWRPPAWALNSPRPTSSDGLSKVSPWPAIPRRGAQKAPARCRGIRRRRTKPLLDARRAAGLPSTTRAHAMPFGAQVCSDGVRFRLWAPKHDHIRLRVGDRTLPMDGVGGGWHELLSREAGPGTRYKFVLPDGTEVPDPASRHQPDD